MAIQQNAEKVVSIRERETTRSTVFGPIQAMVRVDKGAEARSFPGSPETYFACQRFIPGGIIEIYIFGDAKPGQKLACNVELKTRTVRGVTTHYVRAEVSPEATRPAHRLYVGTARDSNVKMDPTMPSKVVREHGRECLVGFIAL